MLSIFSGNSYSKCEPTAVHADAKLALHIILHLQSTQSKDEGAWLGSRPAVALRQTCHVLEALHLLEWRAFERDKENGTAWLVNLSDTLDSTDETRDEVRLHPSRFKTLAWLNDFDEPQIIAEFDQLSAHVNETGLLEKVTIDPSLASMIYVDCVYYLKANNAARPEWLQKRDVALVHVENHLKQWAKDCNPETVDRVNPGKASNASYALDLLLRMKRLDVDDPLSLQVREAMIAVLKQFDHAQSLPSDVLYCAIQLASHYRSNPEATSALEKFLQHLREKYDRGDITGETSSFHPLVLRTLLAFHGKLLHAEMVSSLLDHERRNLDLNEQRDTQKRQAAFISLVRNRVNIVIKNEVRLTGGLTDTPVYRVDFMLTLPPIDGNGNEQETHVLSAPTSVIIKSGSSAELLDTVDRYRNLPDSIKPYFAKHSDESIILGGEASTTAYLTLEDLTSAFRTFHHIFRRVDLRKPKLSDQEKLATAIQIIARDLNAIYEETKHGHDSFFGSQLARLYIGPIERSLIHMCQPGRYQHLKSWMTNVVINGQRFPAIEYYLGRAERHKARLTPPLLMLTHGDCHSRNIMLDDSLTRMKLIDLDKLNDHGDYILDYAMLLEDIGVFCFLFEEDYAFRLKSEEIHFPTKSNKPHVIENRIEYSPFGSTASSRFQELLLNQIEAYAQEIGDDNWKERLWLGLAMHLMRLVAKASDEKRASVLFAEAVKLLDVLVSWLDHGHPLPDIPFPGAPDRQNGAPSRAPFAMVRDTRLADIHRRILALDKSIEHDCNHHLTATRYFIAGQKTPFAVLDGEKTPARLLLAADPEELQAGGFVVEKRKTQSPLRTLVQLDESAELKELVAVISFAMQTRVGRNP